MTAKRGSQQYYLHLIFFICAILIFLPAYALSQTCTDNDGDGYGVGADLSGCVGSTTIADFDDSDNTIYPGAPELCDNKDNDNNGQTDENLTRLTTCGVGACAGNMGTETCSAGAWGNDTCDPLGGTTKETCNDIDDDCDGTTDEDLVEQTECGVGACVRSVVVTCSNGSWTGDTCIPGQPGTETCNGIDDNCDGLVDEGLSRPSTCGVGACAGNTGEETCSSGAWGNDTCDPFAGATPPALDTCNDIDDDCNGIVDDYCPVNIPDANLKTYIEDELGVSDPTVSDMLTLAMLESNTEPIADLTGIEYAKNLEGLYLSGNQISDISPLSGLTGLVSLYLDNNQISDIAPLSGLTGLTSLHLSNNQISDIAPLSGLTGLTSLHLSNNQISDIAPLSGLTGLTSLDLSNNQISDISSLSGLSALTFLNLSNNQISDITPLSGLTGLNYLDLSNNQISDISSLSGLSALTSLNLGNNQISDIAPLSGLTGLTSLDLSNNQIKEITTLSDMVSLYELNLNYNCIFDFTPVSYVPVVTGTDLQSADADEDGICDDSDTCVDVDGDGYGGGLTDLSGCPESTTVPDLDNYDNTVYPGAPELCDGSDNNGNGQTDEGLSRPKTCGLGICAATGTEEICDAGVWGGGECTPGGPMNEGPIGTATCSDSLDNDCDGAVDAYDSDCNPFNAVKPQWMRQMGTAGEDIARGVAVDGSGNVYVTGHTYYGLDGNTTAGGSDLFLVKYNSAGVKQWTRQKGTGGGDFATGVAVDDSGNIYVTGYTDGPLDGNPNAGVTDLFFVKYNSAGVYQWTRQMGTNTADYASGIAVGKNGDIYVAGSTYGGLDGNTSAGQADFFLVKYDQAGVKQWTRQRGTGGLDLAIGVVLDGNGNVYIAGKSGLSLVKYNSAGVMLWTKQGGISNASGVAADGSGNVYVTGNTVVWGEGGEGEGNMDYSNLFLEKYNSSGGKQWTMQMETSTKNYANGVAVDGSGNVYVAGYMDGVLEGNWYEVGNMKNTFLIKVSGGGVKRWTRQIGTDGDDIAYGVAAGVNGTVYVTGATDGGLEGNINAGVDDFFLMKYNGMTDWTRQRGTNEDDSAVGVAVDGSGNAYVAGNTVNGGLDGNTNAGYMDLFLIKYDFAGMKQWTRQTGSSNSDFAAGVAADGSGNVYVTGYTYGGLEGNTNADPSGSTSDLFLVKYDSAGGYQWTRQMGTSSSDAAYGVAVDGSGNVYVTGHTYGPLDVDPNAGGTDLFLVKYDSAGGYQWTRQMGTSSFDTAYGVAVDGSGNVYVTGRTFGGLDGSTNAGQDDIFLVKYDSAGGKQWTRQMGTSSNDKANGVAVDGSGNVYVTGWTLGDLDGNANAGATDIFLVKYDSSGEKQWTSQAGTNTSDNANGVAVLGGDLYIAGSSNASFDGNIYQGGLDIVLLKYSVAQDAVLPTGSVLINGDTAFINSSFVSLDLTCTDPGGCREMRFSNDNIIWSAPEAYATTRANWDVTASAYGGTSGDGTKTVYAKFMDNTGNWSTAYNDAIILDTTLPTGTVTINSNNAYTNSNLVMLDITGSDLNGVSQMQFSNDGTNWSAPETFNATWGWLLSFGYGPNTVFAKVKDNAGNWSDAFSDTITLDNTVPTTTATPPGTLYQAPQTVTLTCNDAAGSGCAETYYCLGAGCSATTLYSTPFTFSVDTILRYYSKDILGNTEVVNEDVYTFVQTATSLSMELSAPRILSGGTVDAVGQLLRLPENGASRNGLTVRFEITGPSPVPPATQATTYTDSGLYSHTISGFMAEGIYNIKAVFDGNGLLLPDESSEMSVYVGPSAGYAIIVEGKIPNGEGLTSHNKTTNRIYKKLKARGFSDDDIYYFNYDTGQSGVDEAPTKQGIQDAVRLWAKWKMNFIAAPLYIIMTNHGDGTDGIYLDNENITPSDLNTWLNTLEGGLNAAALQKKRIVIVGACYSGSFLPVVSKSGRVVMSSSADNEVSHKGPYENDSGEEIRSGEFFLEELFTSLERGVSIREAFEEATEKTEVFTRRDNASWAGAPYFDNAVQHPLLDDDGDGIGSNVLSDDGDGNGVKDLYFGVGNYYVPNSAANPAEVTEVTETVFLTSSPSDNSHIMWAEVNDDGKVDGGRIWYEVRSPSKALSGTGGSGQAVADYVYNFLLYTSPTHWGKAYTAFDEYGKYEIFYFVRDVDTQKVSPMKRSVVYKDDPGNLNYPDAFNLTSPADASEQTTVVLLKWDESVDPDGDAVTYTVMISEDNTFATVDYIKEDIKHNTTLIGSEANLSDLTTYYWKVVAIDTYGKKRESSQVWSFNTDDHNGLPGYIAGYITDSSTGAGITGAIAKRDGYSNQDDARCTQTLCDGYYLFQTDSGSSISVTASKAGYTSRTKIVNLTAGGTTPLSFALVLSDSSPTANFTGSPASGTAPLTVNFTNTTTSGNAPLTYAWDFDNSGSVDSTLTNPSAIYLGPGIYTVKLTATDSDSDANNLIRTSYISVCYSNANIVGSASTYTSLQSAYNAAANTNTIQGRDVTIVENVDFNLLKTVTIQGGFNCDHTSTTGKTIINGNMTISNGTVTMENVQVQ